MEVNKGTINNLRIACQSTIKQHLEITRDRVINILEDRHANESARDTKYDNDLEEILGLLEWKIEYLTNKEWEQ